jgi:hypothetical protein
LDSSLLLYWILPLAGLLFVASAIWFRGQLSGRQVLDLSLEKLGIVVKADAFGVLVLAGTGAIAVAVFSLRDDYQSKLNAATKRQEETQHQVETLNDALKQLKGYDLRLNLNFPDIGQVNPKETKITQYVRRNGGNADEIYAPVNTPHFGPGGILVYFNGLNLGDNIYVVAEYAGQHWRSDDLPIPTAQLAMRRLNDQ